ncbi:hypothetical protein CO2235_150230 [Cupriavidus oxalaticus]|uniref:Beta-Casp domain-containing protein n=1 Tax=Cupriavidus oxalaticus TaxID=96344 RepID=A0A976G912_9BURK|nr:hypothetical protein CO2235_150230 [Cupriavidus oxalaticus]
MCRRLPPVDAVQSREQSIWLNRDRSPKIILAGSGMATGGRVVSAQVT